MLHEGASGRLDRLTVGHLQTSELASLIDHRWGQMGLSCKLHFDQHSDQHFTVQVMTRTGAAGRWSTTAATGILENWQPNRECRINRRSSKRTRTIAL
ncbi:hypothetical protein [Thioalkalivibrio sp. HK1]|uniref:hypothetical protein n=1 Tax=Thioalkalivibrio sp. HK1 TaxID=1469245 RepID=UPI00046EAE01|nr:hypothetical protein [Thioalkalivibrio sp. HK1]